MTWHTWGFFAVTELVLCLSPGPAVLFVVAQALGHGTRRSVWANLGILASNLFYFVLSALGLGAVLLSSHALFLAVKYIGAVYLVWLGVSTIRGGGVAMRATADRSSVSGPRILARGFATQAANPKALVFFVALLPQFLAPGLALAPQVAVLGGTSLVVEFAVLLGYGVLAGRAAELLAQRRFASRVDTVAGALLMAAGAGLALSGRD
ncbi:MAG TPA: LysE family translocator [Gemmatimonadaceae bacterium]